MKKNNKRINFIKTIIILLIVTTLSGTFIAVIFYLNKEEPPKEIILPQPENEKDPFADSLVDRKNEFNRYDLFNYNIAVSIKEINKIYDEFNWVNKNHDRVLLNDYSSIYINEIIVNTGYDIEQEEDKLIIETNAGSFRLELKKINNEPYDYITGLANINETNEKINEYERILKEYNEIYDKRDDKTSGEYEGIGTYIEFVDFIENNGLQKDIGLYTSNQVKSIIEKAYNMNMDDTFYPVRYILMKNDDVISYRFEKITPGKYNKNLSYIETYYLLSDGKNVYACYLKYENYIQLEIDFHEVLFRVTSSAQLY